MTQECAITIVATVQEPYDLDFMLCFCCGRNPPPSAASTFYATTMDTNKQQRCSFSSSTQHPAPTTCAADPEIHTIATERRSRQRVSCESSWRKPKRLSRRLTRIFISKFVVKSKGPSSRKSLRMCPKLFPPLAVTCITLRLLHEETALLCDSIDECWRMLIFRKSRM